MEEGEGLRARVPDNGHSCFLGRLLLLRAKFVEIEKKPKRVRKGCLNR